MPNERLLRIVISAIAITIAVVHLLWPHLVIDAITLGLLVLALLPWLAPLVKSIELSGIGKIELQEIKQQVQEARGAALNAEQQAEYAVARSAAPSIQASAQNAVAPTPEVRLSTLAHEYEHIRETQKPGSPRTANMAAIVSQMIDLVPHLQNYPVEESLRSTKAGQRLSAYAYLYAKPQVTHLDSLVESVTQIEDRPFGQYWGLQAITKVIGSNDHVVNPKVLHQLENFLSQLKPGIDRYYILSRLLNEIKR